MNELRTAPRDPAGSLAIAAKSLLFPLLVGAAALLSTGCYARGVAGGQATLVYDEPVIEVATVPVAITTYPHYVYRGSTAYLVNGRWYYRTHGRWVVFRKEPRELANYRVRYHRHRGHREATPQVASPPAPAHPHRHGHHGH